MITVLLLGAAFIACPTDPPSEPPRLTGRVDIQVLGGRDPYVGMDLEANINFLDGTGTPSFQWRRGTYNITGTDPRSRLHRLTLEDAGHIISVIVIRDGYSGAVTSGPTIPVVNRGFLARPMQGEVSISGIPVVGQTLTANTGGLHYVDGDLSFQWMRACEISGESPIARANNAEYVLLPSDVGYLIFVVVSSAGNSNRIASSPRGPVLGLPGDTDPGTVNITITLAEFLEIETDFVINQAIRLQDSPTTIAVIGGDGIYAYFRWLAGGNEVGTARSLVLDYNVHSNRVGRHSVTVEVEVRRGNTLVPYSNRIVFEVVP